MRGLLVALALCATVGCAGEPDPSDGVRLRFRYEPGDTLSYLYEARGTALLPDTSDAGEPVERPYERRMRIREVATEITPRGHYRLELVYHLEASEAHQARKHPERIRLLVEITPQGRIIDVTGVETAKPLYGDIDFQSYFEQSQPVFPDRPLDVGDSWTQEVKVVSQGSEPVVTSSTYVLEGLVEEEGRTLAVIAYDGDIYLPVRLSSPADPAKPADEDRTTSIEERIRVRGRIYFDHGAGIMRRLEASAEATFTRIGFRDGEPVRRDMRLSEESTVRLVDP